MNTDTILHRDLGESIVGSAMNALNTLRAGLDEKAYENARVIEFGRRSHRLEQQKRFAGLHEGIVVATLGPDLIVDDLAVVDPKVVEDFTSTLLTQMMGYLTITNLRLALLLNFKHADLRWKRVVR